MSATTTSAPDPQPRSRRSARGRGRKVVPLHGYRHTDLGNAQRMTDQHQDALRYVRAMSLWLAWDGARWAQDTYGTAVRKRFVETIRSMYASSAEPDCAEDRQLLAEWAMDSESRARIEAAISLASHQEPLHLDVADMDSDPMLLGVRNGTVDLRTGELRGARREDFITQQAPVEYDPDATCPTWLKFLDRIFPDPEMQAFMQRAVGYSLTGSTAEQVMFVAYGRGNNGKSVLVKTISSLLGEYAQKAPSDLLLARAVTSDVSNDVARLRGARFVACVETDEGRRLAEAKVKELTGEDDITARFLHKEFFTFEPVAKLWLITNHRPMVQGTDDGIWRRLVCFPFTEQITDAERDKNLTRKLKAEQAGILAWAVQGCLDWQQVGLRPPPIVRATLREYRADMDVLGAFLEEVCVVGEKVTVAAKSLYAAYVTWCEENGHSTASQTRLGRWLSERGFVKEKTGTVRWHGIGLRSETGTAYPSASTYSETAWQAAAPAPARPQPVQATLPAAPAAVCLVCGEPIHPAAGTVHPLCEPDDDEGNPDPGPGPDGGQDGPGGPDVPSGAAPAVPAPAVPAAPAAQRQSTDAALAAIGSRVAGTVTSRRKRPWTARSTVYVNWSNGKGLHDDGTAVAIPRRPGLAGLLTSLPEDAQQVYLVGPPPGGSGAKWEAWALSEPPRNWTVHPSGHYLDVEARDRAALRFVRPDGGMVVVMRITSWLDDPAMTPAQARDAFALLRAGLTLEWGEGAPLLATPATTGRELLLRSLPPGHEFPVLSDELRDLMHHTTGQGRFEMFADPHHHTGGSRFTDETIPALHVWDMRWAYAGLCRGALGSGPGVLDEGSDFLGYAPARYEVRFTVPQGWAHVGLLGALDEDGRPWWPSTPDGREHVTWVDGRELILAKRHGWEIGRDIHITRRLRFGTSKAEPLRTWADKLTRVREEWLPAQADADPVVVDIARDMTRSILLQALGALQGRRSKRTHVVADDQYDQIPAGAQAHEAGPMWVWQTTSEAAWAEMTHPEWVAAVWAAQRCRLLDSGPTASQPNVGALHVPADRLLAVRADGIYTTADPGWSDGGRVGHFRPQLAADGPHPTPRGQSDLLELTARLRGER